MSALTINQAADAAQNLAKSLRSIIQVGEVLEEILDLEQTRTEAINSTRVAVGERDLAMAAQDQAEATLRAAEVEVAAARSRALGIVATAEDEVAKFRQDAEDEIKRYSNEVRKQAQDEVDKLNETLAIRSADRDALERHVEQLIAKRDEVAEALAQLKGKLD